MNKQLFQIPAQVEKITTRSDHSLKIEIGTDVELPNDQEAMIMKLRQTSGWVVFSTSTIEEKDIPDVTIDQEIGEKSPSVRLRNVLFILWNEHTNKRQTFDQFYKHQMEILINNLKEKI